MGEISFEGEIVVIQHISTRTTGTCRYMDSSAPLDFDTSTND